VASIQEQESIRQLGERVLFCRSRHDFEGVSRSVRVALGSLRLELQALVRLDQLGELALAERTVCVRQLGLMHRHTLRSVRCRTDGASTRRLVCVIRGIACETS
jgi:hypothetical protein